MSRYIEVALPLPISGTFTYSLPEAMDGQVSVGARVIVPFGKKKFYTGIVVAFAPTAPLGYEVKDVISVLDSSPVVRHPQLKLWEWVADYYLCSLGEVYNAAVPAGLKIESETSVELNPDFDAADSGIMNEREQIVYQLLSSKGKTPVRDVEKETGFRNITVIINNMVGKGVVIISENLVDRFRAKKEKCVRMAIDPADDSALRSAFAAVKGAKKQEQLLLTMVHLSKFTLKGHEPETVLQDALLEKSGCTTTILKALEDKGIVQRFTREVSRFARIDAVKPLPTLTEPQKKALDAVHKSFLERPVTLLHGVASSGKTEIYAHLIDYVLRQGNQVLMLVPEIALTTQLTARLSQYFGKRMLVYHSKFSDNERVEIWNTLLHSHEPWLVVGVRSSVFLPFAKLGLVIADEEHDPSYKQFDPAPRFNARDCGIMLAAMHGAKTLLGSATPAIETYYKAKIGKYGLVSLTSRYSNVPLPQIEIVDMAKERKRKAVSGAFSNAMVQEVKDAVQGGKQAIIYINKRGYAPVARCTKCQYIPKCRYCDVSLTYHKRANALICHYCGASYPLSTTCPACKEPSVELVGYGSERVEDEVEEKFPDARTLRMDLDTTRNKNSYASLIEQFSEHKADILVGTNMVTKGLDFGKVSIAAVVSADSIIHIPDFRGAERAFNILEQVAGRAGRSEQGKVMVQTYDTQHPVIAHLATHDYLGFYEHEIEERRAYAYPPFTRVIYVILKHRDERELDDIARIYGDKLRELFGTRVSGPAKPAVAKVQNLYIRQLMLKVELNASMQKVKEILRELYAHLRSRLPQMRSLMLHYDVDPS